MRTKIAGGWRKILPHFKQAGVWRKGEHVLSKVGDQWKDVSEPHKPASIIDLLIIPTHVLRMDHTRPNIAETKWGVGSC